MSLNSIKVLLVDDDEDDYVMTRDLLADVDPVRYALDWIECYDRAVQALDRNEHDVYLLDYRLGKYDGLELLRKAIGNGCKAPLILLTGQGDRDIDLAAMRLGASDFLIKGQIDSSSLERSIRYAIERSQAERRLQHSREEMILRLARAAEMRDNETGWHIQRMSRYCELIARRAGLPSDQCELIRLASILHDVGKIGIPDQILLKPAPLTSQEWNIMRQHTVIGHRILSESGADLLQLADSIALTHHEKYDGTGYPSGLKGEDIPIEGRIAAIADVFDALTSRRVYKPAMSVEKALRIMEQDRGKHFDPNLLDQFFSVIEQVRAIKAKYDDGTEPPVNVSIFPLPKIGVSFTPAPSLR